jgi:hypothetical protein
MSARNRRCSSGTISGPIAFDRLMPRLCRCSLTGTDLRLVAPQGRWIVSAAVCANRETQILESRLAVVPEGLPVISRGRDALGAGTVRDAAVASDSTCSAAVEGTSILCADLPVLLSTHKASGAMVTVVVHTEPGMMQA